MGGSLDVVKHIHRMRPDMLTKKNGDGQTPTFVAAQHGKLSVVKYFVSCDAAAANTVENENVSCVSAAAGNGHLPVVRYLCEGVADRKVCQGMDDFGETACYAACLGGHTAVVKYFVERYPWQIEV